MKVTRKLTNMCLVAFLFTGLVGEVRAEVGNLVETAVQAGSFKTLIAAVKAADLEGLLAEGGPYTILAPTDTAFEELPNGALEALLKDPDALGGILAYHVLPGQKYASEMGVSAQVDTLNGSQLTVETDDLGVTIAEARVVRSDIEASNGIIHAIDSVILPATVTEPAREDVDPELRSDSVTERDEAFLKTLSAAVRHELMTLPNYDVFDWLEATVSRDGNVVLSGYVVDPQTRSRAETRMERIESVSEVVNDIEVLPLGDDGLRIATYRAVYNWESPLFRYATRALPPIHIIVKNGRVTLKGVVQSESDSQYAVTAARSVPGIFEVRNELVVE